MDADLDLEAKIGQALELGRKFLRVQNAHLTRIDPENDYWGALQSTDPPDGDFPPGLDLDLRTTYCREVIADGGTVALHNAPEQGWDDDPAFREHGLHCYHGTVVEADDGLYGTLCFVSESPRDEPFSETETLFAEMIARELEFELERSRLEAESVRRANSVTVLSRVLRHNLRNDMTVVRGHIAALADEMDGLDQHLIDTALRKADEVIDLSSKARKLETAIASRLERDPVNLRDVLGRVARNTTREYPDADISIDWDPDSPTVMAMDSLETALAEIVDNAAKHGGPEPTVTIAVDEGPEEITIEVTDTGPGVPPNERAVLQEGVETPLVHGSGLGLWMVYWIVTNHDGAISASPSEDGTTVRVTIPRVQQDPEKGRSGHRERLSRGFDLFHALFEESLDAMLITNDDGRYVDVNPATAELFGVDRTEMLGRAIDEFAPSGFETAYQQVDDEAGDRGTFEFERPDGTERFVEYVIAMDVVPGRHLSILRDVTERERHKRALEESHRRFETLVEHFPNGAILVFDEDLRYRNAGGLGFDRLGIDPADWEGRHVSEIYEGETLEVIEELYEGTLDGEFRDQEIEFAGRLFDVHTIPLVDDEAVFGGIVMTQDITESAAAGERAEGTGD